MNSPLDPSAPVSQVPSVAPIAPRNSWQKKALIITAVVFGTAGLAVAGTAWLVQRNVFASPFAPVALTATEQSALDAKVATLKQSANAPAPVDPEVAKRTLTLSEREINAFLEQQGLGEQIKVSLHDGGATATALLPVGENAEVGKGMTLRLSVSLNAKMDANRHFNLSVSDVSVAGVPLPNSWLGYVKGLNLLNDEQAVEDPAVKAFVDGIRDFKIQSGLLSVILNE